MSIFDPQAFLTQTVDTTFDSKRTVLPPGEYLAMIGEPKARTWQGKVDPTKSGVAIDLPLEIDLSMYPEAATIFGQPKARLQDGLMLDLTEDGRGLASGPNKNIRLGQYREATALNVKGQPFNFGMLQGRMVKVQVKHRALPDGSPIEEVGAVGKAS